jgi:hypothetical protein
LQPTRTRTLRGCRKRRETALRARSARPTVARCQWFYEDRWDLPDNASGTEPAPSQPATPAAPIRAERRQSRPHRPISSVAVAGRVGRGRARNAAVSSKKARDQARWRKPMKFSFYPLGILPDLGICNRPSRCGPSCVRLSLVYEPVVPSDGLADG